jgi:hypothetical protein
VNTPFRCISAVLLLIPAAGAQQQSQDEAIYLEEVKKDFLERARKCEESRDWKGLFEHHQFALRRYGQSVVQVAPDRWTSVREYFLGRISKLPREAFDFYRFENDGKARAAFDKARESGSRRDLERAVEEYFFATGTDGVIDGLAAQAFDEGRVEEARTWWNRLLRLYPDSRIPRAVTAARVANACRVSENAGALADLRRYLVQNKVDGRITIGGRPVEIGTYVANVTMPDRPAALRPAKMPYVPDPEERVRRPTLGVRNDIRRWVYDFNEDKGEPVAEPQVEAAPQKAPVIRQIRGRGFRMDVQGPPPYPEFPLLPAYARVRGKEYVIFTDGSRVVAVDPARVKGKSTTSWAAWAWMATQRKLARRALKALLARGPPACPAIAAWPTPTVSRRRAHPPIRWKSAAASWTCLETEQGETRPERPHPCPAIRNAAPRLPARWRNVRGSRRTRRCPWCPSTRCHRTCSESPRRAPPSRLRAGVFAG